MSHIYTTLTIAGFDSSGGAGIQADIKTMSALGCYAMSVLTALPVQNTTGVQACYALPYGAVKAQLISIFEDIQPSAIKIGMLFDEQIIDIVYQALQKYACNIPIVLDPVMMAKSGDSLLQPTAIDRLKKQLLPLSTVITPNIPEAIVLSGIDQIENEEDMLQAAKIIQKFIPNVAIMVKGGHLSTTVASDLLYDAGQYWWLKKNMVKTNNTHGTGCTLSAAICALLAKGYTLYKSCLLAKAYLQQALIAAKHNKLGKGAGPVSHFYFLSDLQHIERTIE